MPCEILSQKHANRQIQISIDKYEAEQRLVNYIGMMWTILEPANPFVSGWHIEAICEHLEAVTAGQIKRLLVNVPPGFMKSLTTEVFWPSWEWGPKNLSHLRYVSASYNSDLTIRDNVKTRRLIESLRYQNCWGDRYQFTSDQNAKIKFENNRTGFKMATSVGGTGTGERGDRFIIDDPHNVKDGESDVKRNTVLRWMSETVPTRLNDPDKSAIIVIMQRVHERDVSGMILADELGYEHLCLPMEFDPARRCKTSIGFVDKRKHDGELLWPERHTQEVIDRDKKALGSYAYAGQFQQNPSPRGGGMYKRSWFEIVDDVPQDGVAVRSWDLAASEGDQSPYTVGTLMRRANNGRIYIEDVVRFRGSPAKVEETIKATAEKDGHEVIISIPQDPGQAGKSQKRWMAAALVGYKVKFSPESGSKEIRAQALASQAEAGNVAIKLAPWNREFLEELEKFPMGQFKDQVDACSRGMSELIIKGNNSNKSCASAARVYYK